MLNKIKGFFLNSSKSKYFIIGLISLVLFIGIFGFIRPVNAGIREKSAEILGGIGLELIQFVGKFLLCVINILIGVAKYNDFINATAVAKGWVMVRDVCNMLFIVILLVIAFCTVLGIEKYSIKSLLLKVLIMAVIINFSKMICGIIIDFAQVAMMTFVNAFKDAAAGNLTSGLGLEEMLKFRTGAVTDISPGEIFIAVILALILLIIATIVVLIITIVLIVRIIALWILVLLSPLAFIAGVIPMGQEWAKKWWSKFTNYVIVGPVLAFFLWLSFSVIAASPNGLEDEFLVKGKAELPSSIKTEVGEGVGGAVGGALETSISNIGESKNLLGFGICIALLLASLMAAQELGVAGGKMAGGAVGKMTAMGTKPFRAAGGLAKKGYEKGAKRVARETGSLAAGLGAGVLGAVGFKGTARALGAKKRGIEKEINKPYSDRVANMSDKDLAAAASTGHRREQYMAVQKKLERGLYRDADANEVKTAKRVLNKYGDSENSEKLLKERPELADKETERNRLIDEAEATGKDKYSAGVYKSDFGGKILARQIKQKGKNFPKFFDNMPTDVQEAMVKAGTKQTWENKPNTFKDKDEGFEMRKSFASADIKNAPKYFKQMRDGEFDEASEIGEPEINNPAGIEWEKFVRNSKPNDIKDMSVESQKEAGRFYSPAQFTALAGQGNLEQMTAAKQSIIDARSRAPYGSSFYNKAGAKYVEAIETYKDIPVTPPPPPPEVEEILSRETIDEIVTKPDVVSATPVEKKVKIVEYIREERIKQGKPVPSIDKKYKSYTTESEKAYQDWDSAQADEIINIMKNASPSYSPSTSPPPPPSTPPTP